MTSGPGGTGGEPAAGPGLDPAVLSRLGHARTPELVEELLAPVRRGRDLAILAGEGSGREILYALAAAHRCDPGSTDLQAMVLSPTRESAGRAARAAYEVAGPAGVHVLCWSPRSSRREADAPSPPVAQLVAGRPSSLVTEVQAGRLGLEGLRLLVLDGLGDLSRAQEVEAAELLLDTLDPEIQTVVTSDRRSDELDRIIERQLSRPHRWPPELFREDRAPETRGPPLRWTAAPGEEDRFDALADALAEAVSEEESEVLVHCPDEGSAHRTAASLSARGYHIATEVGEAGVGVAWGEDEGVSDGISAWVGLPSGLPGLRRTLGEARHRIAVVRPREAAQLRILAQRAGWPLKALPGAPAEEVVAGISRYRRELEDRVEGADVGPELLLLEPVLGAHGFPRVSAALSSWVRELRAGAEGEAAAAPPPEEAPAAARKKGPGPPERPAPSREPPSRAAKKRGREVPPSPWTRLFVPVGSRHEVRPADLVGAITGETDAVGGQIGKIDIRENYSLVEVESGIADRVINQLGGAMIRGREVDVRRDRNQ